MRRKLVNFEEKHFANLVIAYHGENLIWSKFENYCKYLDCTVSNEHGEENHNLKWSSFKRCNN